MKVSQSQVVSAYLIGKQVYEGKFTLNEGRAILVSEHGMNMNTAADFINNFKCVIEGDRYTRTFSAFAMEYFLEQIGNDYGVSGLKKALAALNKHIPYYESVSKGTMHKMRSIYKKYHAISLLTIEDVDQQEQDTFIEEIEKLKFNKGQILKELSKLNITESDTVMFNGKKFKRNNKVIALIKVLREFKCQFCGWSFECKNGRKYIEAAHITAKSLKGGETLTNILLLCPNHHKEFDLGNRRILTHTVHGITMHLNNVKYKIEFEQYS